MNDFLWPLIVVNSADVRTISVAMALSQKFMIRGIAMTGLKG